MKIYSSLFTLLATAAVGMTFTACSNGDDIDATASTVKQEFNYAPASPAKVLITSGDYTLKGLSDAVSRAEEATTQFTAIKVQDRENDGDWQKEHDFPLYWKYGENAPSKSSDRGEQVSWAEYNAVMAYIQANPTVGSKDCFDLVNYFIQNVGSSFQQYESLPVNNTKQNVKGGNQMDYMFLNGNHIYDFNAVNGPRTLLLNCPIKDAISPSYHDSYGTSDNQKEDLYKFIYYDWDNDGKEECYLCFDYASKSQNGDIVANDVYDDWVIKIVPADGSTGGSHKTPKKDETNPTPQKGSIEINLSVNAEKEQGDYVASKLSIHVRDTADVHVTIPVPAELYCKADDMFIVKNHEVGNYVYNETQSTVSMEIAGQTVTLEITYGPAAIEVVTKGINAAVLKELREQYGDGLTFEVWNYYTADRTSLMDKFNQSTVTFTNKIGEYINKINNNLDCTVTRND